jgi:hypothetical protein
MIWFGLVLIVIAAILVFVSQKSVARVHHMKATETSKIGNLLQTIGEIAADMPDGTALGYTEYVELKGYFGTDRPILGQLSGQPAAVVEVSVTHVFERYEETRDSQGRVRGSWRRSEDTMSRDRQATDFFLDDGTGRVRVKGSEKAELVKVREEYRPSGAFANLGAGGVIGFGGVQLSFGGGQSGFAQGGLRMSYAGQGFFNDNGRRTLGYRFVERALPLGRPSYALGELVATEDEGVVLRPPVDDEKKRPFVLAAQTEDELVRAATKKARILRIIAGVLGSGGVALAIAHLVG